MALRGAIVALWATCCGSLLPVSGVRVPVTFHLACTRVHIILSSVWVAEWPLLAALSDSCSLD